MPRIKKSQEFYGIHHALNFHPDVKKFAEQRPGVFGGKEEFSILVEAATRPFFFTNLRLGKKLVESFGRIYARQPDDVLEFMRLVRKIASKMDKTESGKVRTFLLTHQTVFLDSRRPHYDLSGNLVEVIVRDKLYDKEKHVPVSNLTPDKVDELLRQKLVAVASLTDKEIAILLNVKPESVKKARQSIIRQDRQIAFWENPDFVRYMQTGIVTAKLKRFWRTG